MFIPTNLDVAMQRLPWMNLTIMVAIVSVFVLQIVSPGVTEPYIFGIGRDPMRYVDESALSFVTHVFLHADLIHLVGNLIVLWIFGNAICAKLGNLWYALFWIAGGTVAILAHRLTSDSAALGASGAINAVVGAALVMYPRNEITVLVPLPGLSEFSFSCIWLILAWLAFDILGVLIGGGGVAYTAHLGGFAFGFATFLLLVTTGALPPTPQEHTIVDLLGGRHDEHESGVRLSADRNGALLRTLHVHVGGGFVERMTVGEILSRYHPEEADQLRVSVDGDHWTVFEAWRQSHGI